MQAFLLAAGMGTRLGLIGQKTPKCLLQVGQRPLLDYWLEILCNQPQIDTVFINCFHLSEKIHQYVENSPYQSKISLRDEPALYGTGGSLKRLVLEMPPSDDLFVAHADNLCLFDFAAFLHAHTTRPKESVATMMTFLTDSPESCGIVQLNEEGLVSSFFEKVKDPPGCLANGAVFLFSPQALATLADVKSEEPFEISRTLLPLLLGKMSTFMNTVYLRDIGTPQSLAAAEAEFPSVFRRFQREMYA